MLEQHRFGIRGAAAVIRWGYHAAMEIAAWAFDGSASAGGTVTGQVVRAHDFALSQAPLTLVLTLPELTEDQAQLARVFGAQPQRGAVVKWPVLAVVHDSGTVSVEVGPLPQPSGGAAHG